jgi:PucR C-terminal helix-turn-helix domain/GGDEF-like domain
MNLAVQHLVDRLAAHLGRPAVLEDRFFRLITYSAHDDPVDSVREASILRRHASAEVSRWLGDVGVRDARGPVRIPGNAELRMLPRVCFPIRHRGVLFGYLWFIDADQALSPTEVDSCVGGADELGVLLHRESLAGEVSSERVAEAVRVLLSDSPGAGAAGQDLVDDGLIRADEGITVAVAQVMTMAGGNGVALQDGLMEALLDSPRLYRRGSVLHLARKDHSVLVLAASEDDQARLRSRLEAVQAVAAGELASTLPAATLVIGMGGRRAELAGAYESYLEAQMATMVATALPSFGPVVDWSRLGVYQIAARLAVRGDDDLTLHRGLLPLFDSPEAQPLLETLETYLDAAGNAQSTAEVLHLHRTSLYYRLQRVELLAGTDLKDGMERLALHLTLKVARLTGRYGEGRGDVPGSADPASMVRRLSRAAGPRLPARAAT